MAWRKAIPFIHFLRVRAGAELFASYINRLVDYETCKVTISFVIGRYKRRLNYEQTRLRRNTFHWQM